MGKPPEVPDLDLPAGAPSRRPAQASAPAASSDTFDGGIQRGNDSLPPPTSAAPARSKQISVDLGINAGGDDWDDGIERGGGFEPSISSRAPTSGVSSRAPASMKLDVAYRRPTAATSESDEPSVLEKIGGRALAVLGMVAAVGPLVKLVHRPGARMVTTLLPHAFDATSLPQAGAVAGVLLVASIAFGYLGIKMRPRSWSIILSAFVFLIASLAMVTVALVSTDEAPSPADGARLIPYALPLALILLGLGVSGRGQEPFYDGGARRMLPFVAGLCGGLLIYAGIALSAY